MNLTISKNTSVPVYIQIADKLRDQIVDGVYSPGFRFPAEAEFSAALGVNHQTLRKSFHILSKEKLIKQKRGKGTFVIYQTEKLHRIAILGSVLGASSGALWLSGLYEALSEIRNEIISLPYIAVTERSLKEVFLESKAEALVLYGQTTEILNQLSDPFFASIPCVAINAKKSEAENCLCVDVQPNPMRPAVEHLAKLGHRRIGFITREEKTSNLLERERSFWSSLKEFGLDSSPELMTSAPSTYFESGATCALELISGPDPVSAIICPGPSITFGALYGLMKGGVRIPEDVSLIGYDISSTINPHISTLIQPQYEIAYSAGKILVDCLQKQSVRETATFQVLFEERGSTGKPNNKFIK